MRILLINDRLICGGTEVQVLRQKRLLEQGGHDVLLLTFDTDFPQGDERYARARGFVNLPIRRKRLTGILRLLGLLHTRPALRAQIAAEIEAFQPEVIHAHNLHHDPLTVYSVIRRHRALQTLRDYSAVCPLGTCVRPDGSVCSGFRHNDCWRVCGKPLGRRRRLKRWHRVLKSRATAVRGFLTPSASLAEKCGRNGIAARCVNNPFDFERYEGIRKCTDFAHRKYLFYGSIAEHKGIFQLLDAFEIFARGKDVQLLIAGSVVPQVQARFAERIAGLDSVQYLGFLDHDAMLEVLSTAHTIVVPSVWMENYPNTVLEGMALGVLVVGSNRGGILEMLSAAPDFTFDVYDPDAIVAVLEKTYAMSETEYRSHTEANLARVLERNSPELFYQRIMNCFQAVLAGGGTAA